MELNKIPWLKVKSSQIIAIYYHKKFNELYIKFHNNTIYKYYNMSLIEFERFKRSESLGKYFYKHIKKDKPYKKLENGI